ncbi:MAG: FkbM family methyltransferase [Pseudomonadota bacterium]
MTEALQADPSNQSVKDLQTWVSDRLFSIPFQRIASRHGTFFVPEFAQHRPAATAILEGDLFEPETHLLVAQVLARKPGDLVHAGVFFGDMLPSFSQACQNRVWAFEPVLESYVLAKLCIEANGLENTIIFNAALGAEPGLVRLNTGLRNGPHRGGASQVDEVGQAVSMMTIDSLGIENLALLHLDIEGGEYAALQGARETIARTAPIILIEDLPNRCAPLLTELDYQRFGEIPGLTTWARPEDGHLLSR